MIMRINKVIFGFTVVIAALFSSCNKDNEGAIYNNQSTAGVSFTASTLGAVSVPASKPVFDVEIIRGNTAAAATGTVTATLVVDKTEIPGVTVSNYNFAAGEGRTTISVNIAPLEVGLQGTLTLKISDTDKSVGSVATTTLKCSKAYEWKSLGTGTYTDAWTTASDDQPDGITYKVEIMKADGFDRYRIMNPYKEYLASADAAASWGDWIAPSSPEFVEFYTVDGIIYYDDFFIGLNYDGDKNQPIYACHPTSFKEISSEHNKWIDAKTAQFAPYYYIQDLGGWNKTQYDGVIVITLP